jgi:glutaredoxin
MMFIVYSGTDCPKCDTLKAKMKQKGITYREINIREDEEALVFLRSKGHRGIPQIYREVGDELIYVGFDI